MTIIRKKNGISDVTISTHCAKAIEIVATQRGISDSGEIVAPGPLFCYALSG